MRFQTTEFSRPLDHLPPTPRTSSRNHRRIIVAIFLQPGRPLPGSLSGEIIDLQPIENKNNDL